MYQTQSTKWKYYFLNIFLRSVALWGCFNIILFNLLLFVTLPKLLRTSTVHEFMLFFFFNLLFFVSISTNNFCYFFMFAAYVAHVFFFSFINSERSIFIKFSNLKIVKASVDEKVPVALFNDHFRIFFLIILISLLACVFFSFICFYHLINSPVPY